MEDQEKKDQIFSYAVENFKNGLNSDQGRGAGGPA